jgi:ribosomal protein S19E (S16A)
MVLGWKALRAGLSPNRKLSINGLLGSEKKRALYGLLATRKPPPRKRPGGSTSDSSCLN